MDKNLVFENTPIFIPETSDSALLNLEREIPIFIGAHFVYCRKNVFKQLKEIAKPLIIDPVSYYNFQEAKAPETFKKLPYYLEEEPKTLYSNESYRTNNFINPCIEFQLDNYSDIIIAPYLFSPETDDTKFSTNLTILAQSISYLKNNNIKKPLFASIHIGNNFLNRPSTINSVIGRYYTDFKDSIDGYIITINGLDPRKAELEQLKTLTNLVFQLSKDKLVLLKQMGPFGEVLSAIGSAGYINSLLYGEFSEIEKPGGFGSGIHSRILIPELFIFVDNETVRKIGYKCECISCKNIHNLTDYARRSIHSYLRRSEVLEQMVNLNRIQRINFLLEKIKKAEKLISNYDLKYGLSLTKVCSFLYSWKSLLEWSKQLNYVEEGLEFEEELLKKLEEDNND